MRQATPKIEQMVHPRPCANCGRATRRVVNGRRQCWICKGKRG